MVHQGGEVLLISQLRLTGFQYGLLAVLDNVLLENVNHLRL